MNDLRNQDPARTAAQPRTHQAGGATATRR